jgi:hypothetical protein
LLMPPGIVPRLLALKLHSRRMLGRVRITGGGAA